MRTKILMLIAATAILLTSCGGQSGSSAKGDVNVSEIEKAVLDALASEGETNFEIQFRDDEQTKSGTELYKGFGQVPFQTYFVRSKSNWKYKGETLDVYRHLEVKYYKLNGKWELDKARVFNSWLDNVQNPIEEESMITMIKKDPWGSFGHSKAQIEGITAVKDFYNGLPGVHNGQFYPTDYSSKQVKCVYDIVFNDKGRKKGRYEIKFGRGGVDQPWDRVVSYRRIKEDTI